ncbi:MAG: C10 family peptidase [Prevotella sp.]|nr:C10 family peptidase [Prevotella sp.]
MGTNVWAQQVSQDEALQRAQQFFAKPSQTGGMKKAPRKAPRMKAAEVNEAYYIFNDEANGGFVIVSGEERTPDILGYSCAGRFDATNVPINMRAWLDGYKAQIKSVATSTTLTATGDTYVSRTPIAPLLRTQWNQREPFNLLCPMDNGKQCVTGCVATAMAQVMGYWQYPAQTATVIPNRVSSNLDFTHPDIAAGTAIDWAHMPRTALEATTEAQQQAVSELMLYCGMAVNMNYGASASSAYSENVAPALTNYFSYDANCRFIKRSSNSVSFVASGGYNYEDWLYVIYNELRQGHPVYYSGSSGSSGHAFVCDGYISEDYYHIDWGWGGSYNGYFRLSVMNPDGRGTGGGSSSSGYSSNQDAVIGIVPSGHIDTQAPMACRSITLNQKSFARSSTGNFGGITIMPELFATTHSTSTDYALALWQNGTQQTLLSSATTTLRTGEKLSDAISISIGEEVADGEYQIVPVCRKTGESIWQRCLDSDVVYVKAVISGETLTLTPMPYTATTIADAKLVCTTAPVITGTYHYSDNFSASFTIRNDGESYTGPLCIINSTTQDVLAEENVTIAAGETKTVTMTDITPWSMRTDNTQNHFYLGSYIGDVHVSGSEFALAPFPILRVTTDIPELPEAEDEYGTYWIYDTKLNTTVRIEYPEPDGYAPTVNGKVNVQLATANSGSIVSTDLDINLQPGQSVEIPINIPEATMAAYYNYVLHFSVTPIQQEGSKSFKIENNGRPDYAIVVAGGKKVPGIVNYTISITPEEAGYVNDSKSNSIIAGSEISVTAQPFMHYEGKTYQWNEEWYKTYSDMHIYHYFDHWTKNGMVVTEDKTLTTTITEDSHLEAHFKPIPKLTCIEQPIVEGTLETGSMNTYKAVVWTEGDEDYEGDITLTYETGDFAAKASASTHVNIKAGDTQTVSLPLKNIVTTIGTGIIRARINFSHPKVPSRETYIGGSEVEVALYPTIQPTITVLNADAEHYIDTDSILVNVRIEKAANSQAYKGPIQVQLQRNNNIYFGELSFDVDLTEQSAVEKVLTFHSGNSQVFNNYGDNRYDLHFRIYPAYYSTSIGDDIIYHMKTDWGTPGFVRVYSGSSEGGKVGLTDTFNYSDDTTGFSSGMTVHAHATPAEGYYFRCWTDKNGNIVSRDAYYTYVVSFATNNEFQTLKANFEQGTAPAKRKITAEAQPFGQGTVTGSGIYYNGEQVTLTATAAKGYEFMEWQSEDGARLSTSASYTFTASRDAVCTAVFAIYEDLTVTADNKTMVYGEAVPELTYTVKGTGTLKGEPSLITSVRSTTKPGTYDIIVYKGTTNNRRLTLKNGKLTVKKAELTAHVEDATMHLGEELPTFVFTLEGFIGDDTMESTFKTLPRCYVSGGTPTEVGTYPIKMTRGTSDCYNVTTGEGTLTVLAADAIQDILSDDAPADIYTLSGQKVQASAKDVNSLPAGIYIVNGKKVLVGGGHRW